MIDFSRSPASTRSWLFHHGRRLPRVPPAAIRFEPTLHLSPYHQPFSRVNHLCTHSSTDAASVNGSVRIQSNGAILSVALFCIILVSFILIASSKAVRHIQNAATATALIVDSSRLGTSTASYQDRGPLPSEPRCSVSPLRPGA